ncbi:uncharacterized protein K452DRAFT_282925 [Aplosporella prunicola CBS 121167]|uniref:Uncharacterized protein n=1 Tax=Aplosporella prunicola CBS 121167 TaxID=1176127 RepID=A0A6A6BRL6_9PEZI|nr:uncharacterized protein K452DRAFT_282925 [Aplosporella prunicola CBS 121167]KAF2146736.1 hypothetical protein K452DRAFT_282925 [Aplosporella prunicola CBS 121167]
MLGLSLSIVAQPLARTAHSARVQTPPTPELVSWQPTLETGVPTHARRARDRESCKCAFASRCFCERLMIVPARHANRTTFRIDHLEARFPPNHQLAWTGPRLRQSSLPPPKLTFCGNNGDVDLRKAERPTGLRLGRPAVSGVSGA